MLLRHFTLISVFLFITATEALPWAGNNIIISPVISTAAAASNNNSALHNSNNYNFASAQLSIPAKVSFNYIPLSITAEPYIKYYTGDIHQDKSKAAFANLFMAYTTDNIAIKLGRQAFNIPGTEFAIYFGPDDNFDYSYPSYIDGATVFLDNGFFNTTLMLAHHDSTIAGFHTNILPEEFISFSFFSYLKNLPENKLYLMGAGSKLKLSEDFILSAYFALNSGKYKYSSFKKEFLKKYDGYFFTANADFNLYPDYFDLYFNLGWSIASPSDKYSFAYTPISKYNIYGDIAGAGGTFI